MTISDRAVELIQGDKKIIGALMAAFNRGQNTIEGWLGKKDVRLTTPDAVKIIIENTDLKEHQIIVHELEVKTKAPSRQRKKPS